MWGGKDDDRCIKMLEERGSEHERHKGRDSRVVSFLLSFFLLEGEGI